MSLVMLIDDEKEQLSFYSSGLVKAYQLNVVACESISDFTESLEFLPEVSLIVAKDSLCLEVYQVLKLQARTIPIIAMGTNIGEAPVQKSMSFPVSKEALLQCVGELMAIPLREISLSSVGMPKDKIKSFKSLALNYLYFISEAPTEIYQKINRPGKVESDYLLRLPIGGAISVNLLNSWKEQGLQEIYIESNAHADFIQALSKLISQNLNNDGLSLQEKFNEAGQLYHLLQREFVQHGVTKEYSGLLDILLQFMIELSSSGIPAPDLIKSISENYQDFTFKKIHLTYHLSSFIAGPVYQDDITIQIRLAYMALFSDIVLPETLLTIRSAEDKNFKELSPQEQDLVLEHAVHSADLVARYRQAPIDIETLIRQHHGAYQGVGLDNEMTPGLNPLAILYLVAEETAFTLLAHRASSVQRDLLEKVRLKMQKQKFLPTFEESGLQQGVSEIAFKILKRLEIT